jgi:dTDP-glucose 4,6-dehydratase
VDVARISKEVGFEPLYDFNSGLRETVKWYLANRGWVTAVRDRGKTIT